MVATCVGIARPRVQRELGGNDELIAPALEELSQERFAGAVGVEVGGI